MNKAKKAEKTDKIDKVLTHRIWGIPIFLGIMAFVFFCTFTIGDALKGVFEQGLDWFSNVAFNFLQSVGAGDILTFFNS